MPSTAKVNINNKLNIKMESKEKAYEIINKMCDYAAFTDEDCCFTERETMYKNARSLALITVNEILLFLSLQMGFYDEKAVAYFSEVKKHIQDFKIIENQKKQTISDAEYSELRRVLYPK